MNEIDTWAELGSLAGDVALRMSLDTGARLSPLNLAAFVALCLVLYLLRRPGKSFLAWLFPARIYRSASFRLDMQIFFIGQAIRLLMLSTWAGAATGTAALVIALLSSGAAPEPDLTRPVLVAVLSFVAADFSNYWYHRLYHDLPFLWPIHAVHHSAEELNPVAVYRHHPIYDIAGNLFNAVIIGLTQGLLLSLFVGSLDMWLLGGTNAIYAAYILFASNLRHSHIWMRYPWRLEFILISPAQHQVHHSIDPRHYNRNYGEVLAVWDWMFGTLYVPDGREEIRFGLGDGTGGKLPQQHPDLGAALVVPFRQIGQWWRRRGSRQRPR